MLRLANSIELVGRIQGSSSAGRANEVLNSNAYDPA